MSETTATLMLIYRDKVTGDADLFTVHLQADDHIHRLMSRVSPYGIECCTAMTATQALEDRNLRRRKIRNALADMAEEIINKIESGDSPLDIPTLEDQRIKQAATIASE